MTEFRTIKEWAALEGLSDRAIRYRAKIDDWETEQPEARPARVRPRPKVENIPTVPKPEPLTRGSFEARLAEVIDSKIAMQRELEEAIAERDASIAALRKRLEHTPQFTHTVDWKRIGEEVDAHQCPGENSTEAIIRIVSESNKTTNRLRPFRKAVLEIAEIIGEPGQQEVVEAVRNLAVARDGALADLREITQELADVEAERDALKIFIEQNLFAPTPESVRCVHTLFARLRDWVDRRTKRGLK